MIELKEILVPIDFSLTSELALRYAKEFALAFGARLHLVHVSDDPTLFAPTTSDSFRAEAQENSNNQLAELLKDGKERDIKTLLVTRFGSASSTLLDYAMEQDIDLIIMGSHGRTALANILLGSVAEHIFRHAPCPMLTVKTPEHEFVKDD
jgi:nucleotide-binding universal stress UspA family protein